jgi:hypothetical protein
MNTLNPGLCTDGPLVVSPRRARRLLDMGNTRLYELLSAGELDSFLDGRSRKITVESIHRYISRRLTTDDRLASSAGQLRGRCQLASKVGMVASAPLTPSSSSQPPR